MLMTVKDNLNRIVYLEDDVKDLDKRMTELELQHADLMGRLDVIVKGIKLITAIVGASLGIDVGIEGGVI
jgi:hypothetical protein